jgi:ketosteroid isomerase-like protein
MTDAPVEVVREFYRAIAAKDAAALGQLLSSRFDPEVTITWPESLPYGGTVKGARALSALFVGMLKATKPVGPAAIEVLGLTDGGDEVAARLEFDWYAPGSSTAIRTGALELWSFTENGSVLEIRAYYWDTAACVTAVKGAGHGNS